MRLKNIVKTYLWNSKPKKIMELQTFEAGSEVLITLTNGTKLQGTIKDGIVKVYFDADSVELKYPEKIDK